MPVLVQCPSWRRVRGAALQTREVLAVAWGTSRMGPETCSPLPVSDEEWKLHNTGAAQTWQLKELCGQGPLSWIGLEIPGGGGTSPPTSGVTDSFNTCVTPGAALECEMMGWDGWVEPLDPRVVQSGPGEGRARSFFHGCPMLCGILGAWEGVSPPGGDRVWVDFQKSGVGFGPGIVNSRNQLPFSIIYVTVF